MFRDLPRYDNYRAAGAWVGEVPEAWSWEPGRTIFVERKDADNIDEQMLSVTIGRGVVRQAELLSSTSKKDSSNVDKSKYKLVETGDLVYNKMRAWQGAAGSSAHRGIVSPAYIVMTPRASSAEYFHHVVRTSMFSKEAERWSYGITSDQWSLRPEHFKMIRFPLPSTSEQASIVKYLAHANARIDKAITAKRRLVALLEELDRSVENDLAGSIGARTPGDYSIAWLGSMPRAWKSAPAKRLFMEVDRRSATGREGLLSLRMREGLVNANDFTETPIPPENLVGYKIVNPGEIVMNRMRAAIGLFGVATTAGLVSPDYSTMTVAAGVDPDFYLRLFKTDAAMAEFRRRSNGLGTGSSGFMRLYYEDFGPISLPLPSLEEQRRVVRVIDTQRAKTMPVRSRALREISLLREFRTRLVADVVTGQVDVRAIAATLPDAPESFDNLNSEPDDDLEEALSEIEE